ncbi:MAG: hypothetical protein EBT03_10820, partial [Betaproteobacteria bacterium]|nr:hypothetical protein [Betaproteobacteria bacterium]
PDQNAAARYLADGIRTAMRTAMAYNPSEIDSTTLAEFVINACGFATKFNVAKRSAERSARNILEKAKGPAVERDGSGIVDRVSMEECLDAHPISAAVGGGAHHTTEDRPMREWIQNSLLLHTLPQLQLNAYDTHPVDMRPPTLISVVGKNGKVYLCTCAYSNNEWRHTGTEVHVAGLKKTTKSANYAQAAVRILCAVYALGIDAAPESLFPVISGNSGYSVEKLVACAEHACLAETLAEYEKRRALFARHYNEFGLHGFIEKHMTRAGVCFEDIQLQKTDTLDRSKLDLFVRTFKPYMGKSGNGHDALRCLGSSDNIRAMLGTMLVVSMSHLADAKCIGTFVGFDNFRDPESSIIVNVQGC